MDVFDAGNINVEFVWGSLDFRDGYTQIGFFENDAPNWPRIYVTVPAEWANEHPELLNDFLVRATKEFMRRYNAGEIEESDKKFKL